MMLVGDEPDQVVNALETRVQTGLIKWEKVQRAVIVGTLAKGNAICMPRPGKGRRVGKAPHAQRQINLRARLERDLHVAVVDLYLSAICRYRRELMFGKTARRDDELAPV